MSSPLVSTFELVGELSALAGQPVELVEMSFPDKTYFIVKPVDRTTLNAPFWREVQQSPNHGAWSAPEAAVVGFAAGAAGWHAAASRSAAVGLDTALRDRLAAGSQPAAKLIADFAAVGVSHDKLSRMARRMGVVRSKDGMSGGWRWSLPPAEDDAGVGADGRDERHEHTRGDRRDNSE